MSSLDVFCGSKFWDPYLTWNTTNPDFTPCFHNTVLIWIPCGFLWFFAPLETYYLIKSPNRHIPWTGLNISKSVITVLLVLLSLVEMSYSVYKTNHNYQTASVDYYAPFIKLITFILTLCFVFAGRKRGVQTSGILFLFWTLLVICGIFTYLSYLLKAVGPDTYIEDEVVFSVLMIYFPLIFVMFILNCFADARPKYREHYRVDDDKECPEISASFLSQILYWWFNDLAIQGWKRALVMEDLWSLIYEDSTANVIPSFDKHYQKEVSRKTVSAGATSYSPVKDMDRIEIRSPRKEMKKVSVQYALTKAFGLYFVSGAVLKFFHDCLQFASPEILKWLIEYVSSDEPLWKGIFYAVLLFVTATLQSIILGVYFHKMFKVGLRVRTALISTIYRKAMILSNASKRESTIGEIVNLMSVDAQRFMDLMTFINMIWSAPLQIGLALYFLWQVLGPSVMAGFAVMILMIPINGVIANFSKKLQMQQMKNKDERVKVMNEVLGGMKVLKLYAWEKSFEQKILSIRQKELDLLKKIAYMNSVSVFLWTCAPFLVALVSFTVFVLIDEKNQLTASVAFVSLTLFNLLRFPLIMLPNMISMLIMVSLVSFASFVMSKETNILDARIAFVSLSLFHILRFPLSLLPMLISMLIQTSVSLKRINKFLWNEELEPYVGHDKNEPDPIVIESGSFNWSRDDEATLKGIDLHVSQGSLVAVVGTVGSGKSSLLSAMLGEMEKLEGHVNIKASIAYVPQQAWIQNATLRENILFAKSYDERKYKTVIEACTLTSDFEILPGGDSTEIGEKGINLSGGQKQRVSLARAVYNNADLYLLDDPLSAVDSHVGKHIFEHVIGPNGLLKNKTRVLVTHGIAFLPQCDKIVVMKDGSVSEYGTYHELLNKKSGAFAEFLIQHLKENASEIDSDLVDSEQMEDIITKVGSPELENELSKALSESMDLSASNSRKSSLLHRSISRQLSNDSAISDHSGSHRKSSINSKYSKRGTSEDKKVVNGKAEVAEGTKLIQTEVAETGEVKMGVYLRYFSAVGFGWCMLMFSMFLGQQGFSVGSNIWLSAWSNDNYTGLNDTKLRDTRLGVYGALGAAQGFTVLFGSFALSLGTLQASKVLHADLLANIMKSPMSFFDTTPLGRIVNRFSKDIDTVDNTIPMTLRSWVACFLQVVATMIVISMETTLFLTVIIPIGLVYYFIQRFYVASSRQLKRLESVTRSPIYSHFSESLAGVSCIRAYGATNRFIQESNRLVDINQVCYYPSISANRWLAIRLEFCGNCLVFFAALFAVLGGDLSAGSVGLSISYALSVTATLNWMVRMSSELETNIVSVERIMEYTKTPTEAAWELSHRPEANWPTQGEVIFDGYSTRYREGLDLVVKGITCRVKPGEKIGIVGRTGAGKSSLTLSLFRLIEAAEGSIIIDGEDISKMGLHDLRSKLTIIPQDPVLFTGTLKLNLDPFKTHTDDEIWKALEQSHLKTFVSSLEAGLDHIVAEGGENLSVGQRQLLCLARALLRKTKVLILDEATAAVDLDTDDLIQATIRKEFHECTVLTIAHRLNTIMDSDRVLVLDKGIIKEFDSPTHLLQNNQSIFFSMAKDAGLV